MNKFMERSIEYMEALAYGIDPITKKEGDVSLREENLIQCFLYTVQFLKTGQFPQKEKAKTAGIYMDRLSQGKAPFNNKPLPEDSILRHKKLANCFFYLFIVYQRALEPEPKAPVCTLTPEIRNCFISNEKAMSPRETIKELYSLLEYRIDDPSEAMNWLHQTGCLTYTANAEGKQRAVPTQKGIATGFYSQEGSILCGQEARRFIADHWDQFMIYETARWDSLLAELTPELCVSISFIPEAVGITKLLELTRSKLTPEVSQILTASQIRNWLESKGLIAHAAAAAKARRIPTQQGRAIGLSYLGSGLRWSEQAQRYLVSHLREIVLDLRSWEIYRTTPTSSLPKTSNS